MESIITKETELGQPKQTEVVPISTHTERCLTFLESGHGSDLTIFAGRERIPVRAHKLFLSIGSPVLRNELMPLISKELEVDDGSSSGNEVRSLEMPEISPDDVKTFLKFLYTGERPLNVQSALPLRQAARTYEIPELAVHCGLLLLESKYTDDTVLQLYEQASLFKDDYVQKSTLEYICIRAANIVELKQFSEIKIETLQTLLTRDSLAVLDENQLFESTMSWAHAEMERQKMPRTPKYLRSVLETVIHLIRFPLMTSANFAKKVATAQVLTSDEIVAVLLYFTIPEAERKAIGTGLFNPNPRHYFKPTGKSFKIVRSCQLKEEYDSRDTTSCERSCITKFRVNARIWIHSLSMHFECLNVYEEFPTFGEKDDLKIKIEDESGRLLSKRTINLASSGVKDLHSILLDRDVMINKDTLYLIKFRLNTVATRRYCTSNWDNVTLENADEDRSKVRFDFTGTVNWEQFFEGLEIDYFVD